MAIDPHYIPAFSIEDVILDKDTGAPLSGGQVYFEQDDQRGVLKPVYQITGTSPNYQYIQLPNPMTLSAIGTFEDALDNPTVPYFYPFDANGDPEYYFVRVESSDGVPQFTREAVPYIPDTINPSENAVNFGNEISNPQFSEVVFDTVSSNYVFNFTAATLEQVQIAPNWDIVVSGTGTVTVSQSRPQGSLNRLTNPGTLLNINSSGISFLRLRQRIYGSPNLWGSGYLAGTFVAKTFGGSSSSMDMLYSQSNGAVVDQVIVSATLPATGNYTEFSNSVLLPASTSTEHFPDAYIDIDFSIPLNTNIEITSVQVVGTGSVNVTNVPYDQESNYRQIDHLFHYYQPQLNFKPIPSLLVGWDFPLNPAQLLGTATTITNVPSYKWDQTIAVVNGSSVNVDRNTVTGGIQATTTADNQAFCWIQYLSDGQAKKILDTRLSVNVSAFRTQAGTDVTCRAYLYRGSSAAVFPLLPLLIGAISSDGTFTKNNILNQGQDWTEIARSNFGQATGTLSVVNTGDYSTLNDIEDLQFSGWEITDATQISDTDKFCIIVTFQCPTSGTVVTTNSISCVPGDIPTRPAPQAKDEVLRECQYYFEKSWSVTTAVGTATQTGALSVPMPIYPPAGDNTNAVHTVYAQTFSFRLKAQKRNSSGIPTFYSPATGSSGQARVTVYNGGNPITGGDVVVTTWGATSESDETIQMITDSMSGSAIFTTGAFVGSGQNAVANFHYTINDQLGVVA